MAQSIAARGSTSNPSGKEISKVTWQKLRDNAMNKTEFYDISQQSKLLPELKTGSAVHPQLETVDFYKRGRMSHDDYIPQTLGSYHERKAEHKIGYRKDIALDNILENFKEGQLSFVGQAGSGKTTLMKAITRQVIEGKYKNLSNIKVVHFVHLRTFKRSDSVTPAELLFRNVTPEMSDAEMKEAMQYAKENPDKVLFVIDSLDTVSYTVDGVYTSINTDDHASPEAILFHLLSGNLLPGCRFITSSREYAIRNYKGDVRAKQLIALAGLTKESMRKIVVGYVGEEEAEEKMNYLKQKPVIESLCATPVWLIFTLMVLSMRLKFTPTTMASILVALLQNMIRSEHVHEKNIEVVVGKLGKMAFTGTKEHRVEFSLDELGEFNLISSEISDLVTATPSGGYQKLILGDSILMYTHQCLQEILSAFHIAKMNLKEFKEFISKYIHEPHYAVVRRLLTGILLNREVFDEAENFLQDATQFEQKKLCLKKSLYEQLRSKLSKERRLELYMTLSEAGDGVKDIIRHSVVDFDLSEMTLSPNEMYSIGWVISQKTSINILDLKEWKFTQASLSALYHGLECGNCQLLQIYSTDIHATDILDISGNKSLGSDEMTLIAKIFIKCKVKILKLRECQPKSDALKAFLDSSVGAKLDELDVSGNTFGPDEMMVIAQICKQREVDIFLVRSCTFLSGALESFLFHSVGAKLHELDISYNYTLGPDEMTLIANIFVQCKVKILKHRGCGLKSDALKAFLDSSVGAKLHELNISHNENLGPDEMTIIAKIFVQCKVKVLRLSACHPKVDALKAFSDSSVGAKLDELDVSYSTFGPDEMMVIAQICKQREVDRFRVCMCTFLSGALESFLFHSVGAKLHELDISFNETLGPNEMTLIAKIFVQCKVKMLKLLICKLKSGALKAFLDSSVGAKILLLDISDITLDGNDRTLLGKIIKQCGVETLVTSSCQDGFKLIDFKLSPDNFKISTLKCGDDEYKEFEFSDSVSNFLPYVVKEVILFKYVIYSHMVRILQNRLDEEKNKGLKIIFKDCLFYNSTIVEGKEFKHKVLECREQSAANGPLWQKKLPIIFQRFFSKAQRKADISRTVPSIVENRRAELNNDGSIAVSWRFPDEDPDVQYHVETFCNNQPTGDIEICRDPYYQCKTPRPSQVHCFNIWVVDSNGIAGDAMFTNEVMSNRLDENTLPGTSVARYVPAQSEKGTKQDIAAGSIVRDERTQTMIKGPSLVKNVRMAIVGEEIFNTQPETDLTNTGAISEPFSAVIPSEGGDIELSGSILTLHRGTFTTTTKIFGKEEIDQKKWPANYVGITSMLYVNAENDLLIPATLQMTSWCTRDPSQKKAIMAHVLHYCEQTSTWELIKELPLGNENAFQFDCLDFSPIIVAIQKKLFGSTLISVDGGIYVSNEHLFTLAFHRQHRQLEEKVRRDMKESKSCLKMGFSTIQIKPNQEVEACLYRVKPEEFILSPTGVCKFSITYSDDRQIVKKNIYMEKSRNFTYNDVVVMESYIRNGGKVIDGPHRFPYVWKDRPGAISQAVHQQCRMDERAREAARSNDSLDQRRRLAEASTSTGIERYDQVPFDIQEHRTAPKEVAESTHDLPAELSEGLQRTIPKKINKISSIFHSVKKKIFRKRNRRRSNQDQSQITRGSVARQVSREDRQEYHPDFWSSSEAEKQLPLGEPELTETSSMRTETRGSRNPLFVPTPRGNEFPPALKPQLPFSVSEPSETHSKLAVAEIHPRQNFDSLHFDQPSTSRQNSPPNTGRTMFNREREQYYYGAPGSSVSQGYGQMHAGFHDFPNTTRSQHFGLEMETPSRTIVDAEEARRQAPPSQIPDPKLVLEKTKIRVSWDKSEDERVTYYIDLYCNGQKQNAEPCKTPATYIQFSKLEPSSEYRCEVWARNSHGVDGLKTWSNAVETDNLIERQPGHEHGGDSKEGEGPSTEAIFSSGNAPITITHSTITVSGTTNTAPRSTQP